MRISPFAASVLFFLPPAVQAQNRDHAKADAVNSGEIAVSGTISEIDYFHCVLKLKADTVRLQNGSTVTLSPPRDKSIRYTSATRWFAVSGKASTVFGSDLRPGGAIRVLGKDVGPGKTMPARQVTVTALPPAPRPSEGLTISAATNPGPQLTVVGESGPAELNSSILEFCRRSQGTMVGNGQCMVLAEQAVKNAGGVSVFALTENCGPNDDYIWGRFIYSREVKGSEIIEKGFGSDVRPGDIIQYRNVAFANSTDVIEHHTAVIARIAPDGVTCTVFEQNSPKIVRTSQFVLPHMTQGIIKIYRAIPDPKKKG